MREAEILKTDHEMVKYARKALMQLAITYNQETSSGYYELDKMATNREIGKILIEVLERGKQSTRETRRIFTNVL